jgi:hypothetical protein
VTQSSHRRLRIPSFLLAAALAAACGGSPDTKAADSNAAAEPLDACTLFTAEDAQAIAGESIAAMSSTLDEAAGRDPGQCIYNSGNLSEPRILSLLIRPHRSAESAKRVQEASRSTLTTMAGRVQDVPGLGEGALWVGGQLQQLHILHGDRQLIITVQSPDGTDQLEHARKIASTALARIQDSPSPSTK